MRGGVLGAGTGTGAVRVRGRHGVDARRRRHTCSTSSTAANSTFLCLSTSVATMASVMSARATTGPDIPTLHGLIDTGANPAL